MKIRERIVREVEVFVLLMNPVHSRSEDIRVVAISYDYNKLVNYVKSHECEKYRDENGYLIRYTGELSCYNPPYSLQVNCLSSFGEGIKSEWIDKSTDLSRYKLV